jgi:uncharacterized protein (DUF952 family)
MAIILHITSRDAWDAARSAGAYRGDTLDTEGFIHCSTPAQVVSVAEAFFPRHRGLVLLAIDEARVQPEIRYEGAPGGDRFPHIYGPLNLDAVVRTAAFEPGSDGHFTLPAGIADPARSE